MKMKIPTASSVIIKQVEIGDYFVSTIYLPILGMFDSNCYETMAFRGIDPRIPLCQYRSETEEKSYECKRSYLLSPLN
jgi:hypothetical protein